MTEQTEMVRTDQITTGDTLVHRYRNGELRPERTRVLGVEALPGRSAKRLRYVRPDGVETDGIFAAHFQHERIVSE